jgi:hypothetical protein
LAKLLVRAKEAETRAAAARNKARADLEQDVSSARATAQAGAAKLSETADIGKGRISVWWRDVQRTWNEHLATVRENIDAKRAEHDLDRAEKRAENAEDDALFAIDRVSGMTSLERSARRSLDVGVAAEPPQ